MAHIEELRALGRPQMVERAISLFQQQAAKGLNDVDTALHIGGAVEVERAAHALKSAALSIGGRRFAAIAGDCEQAARKGDLETAGYLAMRLRPEFSGLCEGLTEIAADGERAA
jgi:HPt (histidine-containing phosphotransfer) domain-containing protein